MRDNILYTLRNKVTKELIGTKLNNKNYLYLTTKYLKSLLKGHSNYQDYEIVQVELKIK